MHCAINNHGLPRLPSLHATHKARIPLLRSSIYILQLHLLVPLWEPSLTSGLGVAEHTTDRFFFAVFFFHPLHHLHLLVGGGKFEPKHAQSYFAHVATHLCFSYVKGVRVCVCEGTCAGKARVVRQEPGRCVTSEIMLSPRPAASFFHELTVFECCI